MTNDKQIQKAGKNAQQTQIDTMVVNVGITEQRAREIYTEMTQKSISENTAQGVEIANRRINTLEDFVIPKIQEIDAKFESFTDPAFQVLLKKAQLTAACTEREADYKILAELLAHRIKNRTNIKKKASITKAVEIIDKIDDDSLCGLTVFLAVKRFGPITGNISEGLKVLDDLYEKLELNDLPTDNLWIDNLSVLGTITITPFSRLEKYEEFLAKMLDGYACAGIKKDSPEYEDAIKKLMECHINSDILIDNELLDGYVRLAIPKKSRIRELQMGIINGDCNISIPISKGAIECLEDILKLYSNDKDLICQAKDKFNALLQSFSSIKAVSEWFNSIKSNISLTSIGTAVAHTNSKRYDDSLPDLD